MNEQKHKSSDVDIIELMSHFVDKVHIAFGNAAEEFSLDTQKARVLMTLYEDGCLRQVEVSQRVDIAQYATSRIMDFLQEKDLLHRIKDPASRRSHLISLTEEGQSLASQLFEVRAEIDKQTLRELSLSEKEELIRLMKKVTGKAKPA